MGKLSFNSIFGISLVIVSTIFVSFAQVLFKTAWSDTANFSFLLGKVIFGFTLYGIGAILFLMVLRKKKVSFLMPFMTLSYVWVIILSAYLFGEIISLGKILGVGLILTGIFLIYAGSTGDSKDKKVKPRASWLRERY